jgi:mono/diheme cytochrome c family protein
MCILSCINSKSVVGQPKKPFKAPPIADEMKNPLKGDNNSVIEGKRLYILNCASCHGDKGRGDGIAAAALLKPPADHTSAAVQNQTDGAIFWKITNGLSPMPTYVSLPQTQRWQLVNYIRTLAKVPKK